MTHQNRSTGATCAHEEETRNEKKKERDRNFTVVIWVLAETIYDFGQKWNFAWWVVFGGSSKVQVSSRSIQQFPWCGGGSKFTPLHWLFTYTTACTIVQAMIVPSMLWHYSMGIRKSIQPVKRLSDEVLAWLYVWSELHMICMWSSWCHCHPNISCFIKIQNGLTILVPGCHGKRPLYKKIPKTVVK